MSSNSGGDVDGKMVDEATKKKGVKDVCKQFLLKSDEILANKLQFEECFEHYKKNKMSNQANRTNIEKSMPLVKSFENEYRDYLNKKMAERRNREIEETDAAIALEIQREFMRELEREQVVQQIRDRELAKRLQEKEILIDDLNKHKNNHQVADNETFYAMEKLRKEQDDFTYAKYLQEQEEKSIIKRQQQQSQSSEEGASLVSKLQRKLQLHHVSSSPPPKISMSQSNCNINKQTTLINSSANDYNCSSNNNKNSRKILAVSCKNLNHHHQNVVVAAATKSNETNKNRTNTRNRSISEAQDLKSPTSSLSSTPSSSPSSTSSLTNSSSIESSSHQHHKKENIYLESKSVVAAATTSSKQSKPSPSSTTIEINTNINCLDSNNNNNNKNSPLLSTAATKRGQRRLSGEYDNDIAATENAFRTMDLDCNTTDYMSPFSKSGHLVEEESLISGGPSTFDNHKSKASNNKLNHNLLGTEEPLLPSRKSTNKKEYGGQFDFNKEDITKNIVAAIDPTFQTKIAEATATATGNGFDFDKDRLNKAKDIDSFDADTDMFLPVQGQKRGTVKNNLKKKKSQSQCLQQ